MSPKTVFFLVLSVWSVTAGVIYLTDTSKKPTLHTTLVYGLVAGAITVVVAADNDQWQSALAALLAFSTAGVLTWKWRRSLGSAVGISGLIALICCWTLVLEPLFRWWKHPSQRP